MTASRAQDLDLSSLLSVLRRAAMPVLVTALVLALLTFLYSRTRPAVYEATASVAALPSGSSNSVINSTLVTAPPLPPSVVAQAVQSPDVVNRVVQLLDRSVLPGGDRDVAVSELQQGLRDSSDRIVSLSSDVDLDSVGVYQISARAATPQLAQVIANDFVTALLGWDRARAQSGITRAQQNLAAQRDNLTARITAAGNSANGDVETRSLISARGNVIQTLQQVDVLAQTVNGTLTSLSAAPLPTSATEPRPARNALIVFAAALFFGVLTAFTLDNLRQRVRGADDLRHLGAPVLGTLPPLPIRAGDTAQIIYQTRQGVFREQMDFVRVGLLSSLGTLGRTPVVVVSSAQPGEGKSTVAAGLAASLASHGLRIMVLDADVYRPRQQELWRAAAHLKTLGEPQHLGRLLIWPGVTERVDLAVPAAAEPDVSRLAQLARELSHEYDMVVVDTPPLLKVADALALSAQLDGLLMVADSQVSRTQVERAVAEATQLGATVRGFVVNRVRESTSRGEYAYIPSTPLPLEK